MISGSFLAIYKVTKNAGTMTAFFVFLLEICFWINSIVEAIAIFMQVIVKYGKPIFKDKDPLLLISCH